MTRRLLVSAALAAACLTGCGAAESWAMPDVVGIDLQTAQDTVQRLTEFRVVIASHDQTGANRSQVYDHDWTVCTQSIPAGAEIRPGAMVDFGVVEEDEDC